jgi:hypothetical protein
MKKIGFLIGVLVLSGCAGLRKKQSGIRVGPSLRLAGLEIVAHKEILAPNAFINVHVECPPGKKVLGGGFDIETPDYVKVFSSEPSDGKGNAIDHGWNVSANNAGAASRQVTVSAVCASLE